MGVDVSTSASSLILKTTVRIRNYSFESLANSDINGPSSIVRIRDNKETIGHHSTHVDKKGDFMIKKNIKDLRL